MEECVVLELKDIENKVGRKVPESLLRSLRENQQGLYKEEKVALSNTGTLSNCSALERLETKIQILKRDMARLRAIDVKLMHQLLSINEGIESIKWMMEEKGNVTSRGSSLTSSLYSLAESQSTSLQGSWNSLQDGSDGLDEISVGSYLDTLADLPGHCTSSDLDPFSDECVTADSLTGESINKESRNDSDDGYYYFG
ncbi:leucine rich adaptor protein 1-like [Stegostoma tigrinum]|uniref:leucine rich adaptor protein 1-like n=1 Tax=Stegostoma tigrinum TaxID=3053191 RepID=UPI00202B82CC|nr:leucine rich adaptor protein 1-like [Stegostoma tigrinum]XP_059500553.1 leucine rich adaptor protein 1-like [Stegostoma tigrinum]XP_059500554.1 leucine rich adaptor protein 1-like [Stegostoma tigrinum]XP_059500555.1 leucine rich adaptor protein 1-like [Stegostoma tigrinum]XP_059500556.1 leucine rich adaptor protein 1-like [Stegostoma tigrinum]XP_059500557.1 leucine rich adaptor protein 1-like [Stegostoma tigrinum]XP_059500558.1 leucine rich adaptor protein 1-like [Stegostoma tigrinum]XP_0